MWSVCGEYGPETFVLVHPPATPTANPQRIAASERQHCACEQLDNSMRFSRIGRRTLRRQHRFNHHNGARARSPPVEATRPPSGGQVDTGHGPGLFLCMRLRQELPHLRQRDGAA